jgi:predicted nucleic acid-binding protein
MSDRFFLDTNIFVYLFDQGAPQKTNISGELIDRALTTRKGAISFQVVQEFFNVILKRPSKPMTVSDAQQYLSEVFRPLLAVHSSVALYSEALRLHAAGGLSWYDALIVAGALQANCEHLFTEDLQHGRKFGPLKIVNPFL